MQLAMPGVVLMIFSVDFALANWEVWWTYEGISGPAYWGLINPSWTMCNKGRRQSPINIEPTSLTHDSGLGSISVDKHLVSAMLENTGQSLVLRVAEGEIPVNITGGPLAYMYQFQEIIFHWGEKGFPGSEHTVNEYSFPAEIQLYGFNSDLYQNLSMAREQPGGVVGVSIMVQVRGQEPRMEHDHMHSGLGNIISMLSSIKYGGDSTRIKQLSLANLMPNTEDYVTYEGSTTFPGCWETTTWIVMNKPVYISRKEMEMFYQLRQGDKVMEKAPLGNNLRPRQPLNNRSVRTNIALKSQKIECDGGLPEVKFATNEWVEGAQVAPIEYRRGGF